MHFNDLVNKNNAEYNQRQRDIQKATLASNTQIDAHKKDHERFVKRDDSSDCRHRFVSGERANCVEQKLAANRYHARAAK